MNIHITKRLALGVGLGAVLVAGIPHLVSAISMDGTSTLREEAKELREEKKQQAQEALKAKKAATCEKHKEHISQVMSRVNDRSQRIYDRLSKVSELLQKYYDSNNLSIDNYDSLLADVRAKGAIANTKLNVMLTLGSFSCDEDNPRQSIADYREGRKAKVTAMKAYRQSIRTLLTEVKSAVAAKKSTSSQTDGGNV